MYSSTVQQSKEHDTGNSCYFCNGFFSRFRLYSAGALRRYELNSQVDSFEVPSKHCRYDRLSDVASNRKLGVVVDMKTWSPTNKTDLSKGYSQRYIVYYVPFTCDPVFDMKKLNQAKENAACGPYARPK